MFRYRSLNEKINRLHESCLRVIYNDSNSSYDELSNLGDCVNTSQEFRNIQKCSGYTLGQLLIF